MPGIRDKLDQYDRTIGRNAPGRGLYSSPAFAQEKLASLGCGYRCLRYGLAAQAGIILASGVVVCAVGAWLNNDATYSVLVGSSFLTAVLVMGCFLLFLGAIGLTGALNESRMGLLAFVCLMVCMLIVLISLGSYAVSKKGKEAQLCATLWQTFDDNEKIVVQNYYFCCGAYYGGELAPTVYPHTPKPIYNCPTDDNGQQPTWGCISLMASDFSKAYQGFGTTAIILGVFFIATTLNACCLNYGIANAAEESLRRERGDTQGRGGRRSRR